LVKYIIILQACIASQRDAVSGCPVLSRPVY